MRIVNNFIFLLNNYIMNTNKQHNYFKLLHYDLKTFYVTKQYVINYLYPNMPINKQQKILMRCQKNNFWNINNDYFEPCIKTFYTCAKNCPHEYGYCDSISYQQEILLLKNINDLTEMSLQSYVIDSYKNKLNM